MNTPTPVKNEPVPTPALLLAQPTKFFSSIKITSIQQALQSPGSTLVTLQKQHGQAVAAAILVKILAQLIAFFNVGKSMNDYQCAETVKLIMQQYYFLKLEDLKLCFDGMKCGKYLDGGKLFDRLDGQIILLALQQYTEERIAIAEQLNADKHKQLLTEPEEQYVIMLGDNYFATTGEYYFEEPRRDAARRLTYVQAQHIKHNLIRGDYQHAPHTVKIKHANKAQIGIITWMQQHTPHLLPPKLTYAARTAHYHAAKRQIENDPNLTGYQKHNRIRALAGLAEVGEEEWEESLKFKV